MNPFPFFIHHQKTPEQKDEEERQKIGNELKEFIDRMTPEQRKQFWKQHDKDTGQNT